MTLERVADGIWIANGDVVNFYGFPYSTRCVIIELSPDELWVWSPIELSPELKANIDAIGQPRHLVSPNKIHHLFLGEWHEAWPGALLWGPPSTIRKRRDLQFEEPLGETPPAAWRDLIDQHWFHRSLLLDEIVFFHRSSRTIIMADLSENFSGEFLRDNWSGWQRWIAKRWRIVEGYGYAPLELRLTSNRKAAGQLRETMLGWNPERVIMAHGEWQASNGRAYIEQAFAWTKKGGRAVKPPA